MPPLQAWRPAAGVTDGHRAHHAHHQLRFRECCFERLEVRKRQHPVLDQRRQLIAVGAADHSIYIFNASTGAQTTIPASSPDAAPTDVSFGYRLISIRHPWSSVRCQWKTFIL